MVLKLHQLTLRYGSLGILRGMGGEVGLFHTPGVGQNDAMHSELCLGSLVGYMIRLMAEILHHLGWLKPYK